MPFSEVAEVEDLGRNSDREDFTEAIALQDDLRSFEDKLGEFKMSFQDLVNEAPKHKDTRINGLRIARYIVEQQGLKEALFKNKTLPSAKIIDELGVTEKMLKRSRKFIIASVLILDSELEMLKSYIIRMEGGGVNGIQRSHCKD